MEHEANGALGDRTWWVYGHNWAVMPVMQRKLSGEHVREERIYTLLDGRNSFCVFHIYIYIYI